MANLRERSIDRAGDARAATVGADDEPRRDVYSAVHVAAVNTRDPAVEAARYAVNGHARHQCCPSLHGGIDEQRVEDVAARRDQHVDVEAVLDRARHRRARAVEHDLTDRGCAGIEHCRQQSPAGQLHTPLRAIAWVDNVSLGKALRSTSSTSWPAAASSIAVAAPAHRAPTTTTS